MNRFSGGSGVLVIALGGPTHAQQKPATAADKAAAEEGDGRRGQDGAEMAEAMARAQQKVAEEAQAPAGIEAAREEEASPRPSFRSIWKS